MNLKDLLPIAMVIVVTGIGISIGADITETLSADTTAEHNCTGAGTGTTNCVSYDVTTNTTAALGEIGDWMPTIGLVVAAAIVLGILLSAFYFGRN